MRIAFVPASKVMIKSQIGWLLGDFFFYFLVWSSTAKTFPPPPASTSACRRPSSPLNALYCRKYFGPFSFVRPQAIPLEKMRVCVCVLHTAFPLPISNSPPFRALSLLSRSAAGPKNGWPLFSPHSRAALALGLSVFPRYEYNDGTTQSKTPERGRRGSYSAARPRPD